MTAKRRKNSVSCENILRSLERTSRCSINSWLALALVKYQLVPNSKLRCACQGGNSRSSTSSLSMIGPWKMSTLIFGYACKVVYGIICDAFFPMGEICFNEYISLQLFSHKKQSEASEVLEAQCLKITINPSLFTFTTKTTKTIRIIPWGNDDFCRKNSNIQKKKT